MRLVDRSRVQCIDCLVQKVQYRLWLAVQLLELWSNKLYLKMTVSQQIGPLSTKGPAHFEQGETLRSKGLRSVSKQDHSLSISPLTA